MMKWAPFCEFEMMPGLSFRSGAHRGTNGQKGDWSPRNSGKREGKTDGWPLLVAVNLGALVLDDRHGAQLALE